MEGWLCQWFAPLKGPARKTKTLHLPKKLPRIQEKLMDSLLLALSYWLKRLDGNSKLNLKEHG